MWGWGLVIACMMVGCILLALKDGQMAALLWVPVLAAVLVLMAVGVI